jgi:chromosome segregation ATPase
MAQPVDDNQTTASENTARRRTVGAALGLVAAGVLILGGSYYAYTTRSAMESRLADLDERFNARLAEEIQGMRQYAATLTTDIAAASERAEGAVRETEAVNELGRSLKRAHDRTARTVTAQATDIKAIQQASTTLATDMTTRIAGVSAEVNKVAAGLASAGNDVADNRRQITALKAVVTPQIANNTKAVAELRRLGERELFEFDVRKSSTPPAATVADVRIRLTKTDVRKGKYEMVLHVDDRQIEKKDRTIGEPVQFLVGPERQRYELVVTDVDRDRIRGYLSVARAGADGTIRVAVR